MTSTNGITQPILWSSEYFDPETYLLCYNYRYYNPKYGVWISKDIHDSHNKYAYPKAPTCMIDRLGMYWLGGPGCHLSSPTCGYYPETIQTQRDLCLVVLGSIAVTFVGTAASGPVTGSTLCGTALEGAGSIVLDLATSLYDIPLIKACDKYFKRYYRSIGVSSKDKVTAIRQLPYLKRDLQEKIKYSAKS